MSNQAEGTRPVLAQNRAHPATCDHPDNCRSDPHSHNGLQHIGENDHQGQRAAEGSVEIGQACVAAAVLTDVVPQDILGDDDRAVEAAAEIGCYRHCQEYPRE